MKLIVDTNVPVVANQIQSPQASPTCIVACAHKIQEIRHSLELCAYLKHIGGEGQRGPGA